MADDLSDLDAAFGVAPATAAAPSSPALPGEAPPLTVTAQPHAAKPDDLSDIDTAFAQGAPAIGPDSEQSTASSLAASPFVGFNKGVANTLGFPVDTANRALGSISRGGPFVAAAKQAFSGNYTDAAKELMGMGPGLVDKPFGGSETMKQGLGLIGANPDEHQPRNATERILGGLGEGAAGVMLPEAAVGAIGSKVAPQTAAVLDHTFGSAKSVPGAVGNATVGALAGAGGEGAAEVVPDKWKPAARLAGNVLGGGVGAGLSQVPTLARAGARAAGDFTAPMRTAGQEGLAGTRLAEAMGGKDAGLNAIQDNPGSLVPGSQPTLAEQVQIPGVSALQHQVETENGVPFQERRATQNQARVDALGNVQPTGAPEEVANRFRSNLAALDQKAEGLVNARTGQAQTEASNLGGTQTPEFYGSQISGEVQPQIDAATRQAVDATRSLGGTGTPEEYGAAQRAAAETAKAALNAQRRAHYDAIDPDGTLNIVASPVRTRGEQMARSIDPLAQPATGEEAAILHAVTTLPDVIPFNSLRALDSRITAAVSQERRTAGETPAWGRLTQLKGAVQDAISNGVANQVEHERQAVSAGAMQPEQTLESRLRDLWGVNAGSSTADLRQSAQRAGPDSFGFPGDGSTARTGSPRTGRETAGRTGEAAGDQGISPPPLQPNFDEAAASRLDAAKQTHAAYAQTFKQGPIGDMLRTNGFAGQYRLVDSGVPDTIFAKGPKGAEKVQAYRQAVRDDPAAVDALQNHAAMSLRRAAERPDGTIDPARFATWLNSYRDALRAVPELHQRFANIQSAAESLKRFAPFRQDLAPSAIPEMFFHSGPSGAEGVRSLRGLVGDQRADSILSDYAASRLKQAAMRPDGTLDPKKTALWQKQHTEALGSMPGLSDRFSSVAKASEAVADAAALRKAATDAYQKSSVGKLLSVRDASDVTNTIGSLLSQKNSAVGDMRQLAAEAAKDPDSKMGLRKAIVDYMHGRFIGNADNLKSDQFQTFLKEKKAALATVFKPEEIANMEAIAADLARQKKVFDQSRLPGQSVTTPDAIAAAKRAAARKEPGSLFDKIWKGALAGGEGGAAGAIAGTGVAIGSHVLGGMRNAGFKKVDDLIKAALLNETGDGALAKSLLMKAPARPDIGSEVSLGQQLRRLSAFSGAQLAGGNDDQEPPHRAAGGRVEVEPNPSEAQKAHGNYKKHHMRVHGLDVTIENPKGSFRSGVGGDGKPWRVKMPNHYGYVRGTIGADGDHVDCYVGPDEASDRAFVVDQRDLGTGKFDESKCMIGFKNREAAIGGYRNGFSDGKGAARIMKVTPMSVEQFKDWLKSGDTRAPVKAVA